MALNLKQVKNDWLKTSGPFHVSRLAEHYGVFEHLFGAAYFIPRVELNVSFQNGDIASPVYYGNIVKPSEATTQPEVVFDPNFDYRNTGTVETESWWTLVLTNPDGHFSGNEAEYCHWFV